MDIYWVKDGRRCGPATVPDVISLVRLGELPDDVSAWHAGCAGWMPLRELPALADFLAAKTPEPAADDLPPVPEADAAAETEDGASLPEGAERVWMPSPATRLLARGVDVALYMGVVYLAVYLRGLPYSPNLLPASPYFWLGFVAAEAALVAFFGTTPGKSFFGIRLIAFSEGAAEPMGFLRALGRALMVFVGGMGMMVSFLPLVMSAFSWWTLRRHGITYWDARMGTFPAQKMPTGALRLIMAALLIMLCFQVASYCLQPWLPSMVEDISAQSPEAGEMLQRLLQESGL